MTYDDQLKATNAICDATLLMFEYGAESVLIEQTSQRLGKALKIDSVELALLSSAIIITTITSKKSQTITISRRVHNKPVNMSVVCDVLNLVKKNESCSTGLSSTSLLTGLENIQEYTYNRWLVVFVVALSCSCFSYLHGSDFYGCFLTFLTVVPGVIIRQELSRRRFSSFTVFSITPFLVTLIAAISLRIIPISSTPEIILVSVVLFLVPGFPFVNSFLDAIEGYMHMAWVRFLDASLLVAATSIGIVIAMGILNLKVW